MAKHSIKISNEVKDLVPGFLENRKNDVLRLKAARAAQDLRTIEIVGHNMKGSAGGYGFDEIGVIGKSLEDASKSKSFEKIDQALNDLEAYLDDLEIVYAD